LVTDSILILRKLADLQRHREELREFEAITVEAYRADWKIERIVERTLQMMIEICCDVANHIIAEEGLRIGQSVADSFRSLGEGGVLPAQLIPAMVSMGRFRNIVVHQYADVDDAIVVGILHEHLGDFAAFSEAILAFLDRQRGASPP